MGNRYAYRAFAKIPALALLLAGAQLGCSADAQTASSGDPGSESTATSDQPLLSAKADHETCDQETDGGAMDDPAGDPPGDPSPTDCGATTSTATCRVRTTASPFVTFRTLQGAINASGGRNALITVSGHCPGATVNRGVNLTIQGPFPTTGCGFMGPGPRTLSATVDGINVQNSTNILVQNLNLVNSVDGVAFVNSTNSIVSCACAAHNTSDGVRMTGGTTGNFTQILSELNRTGIESNGTSTVIIAGNTVTANTGTGIFVRNATNQNVSVNLVTNNGGPGILFQNVTNSIASANTIRGNGDGLRNLIECTLRSRNNSGNNVPRSCM
jgi:parallel beta-helix repeat protein